MQTIELANKIQMPILGFGVYQINTPTDCKRAVLNALEAGYRSIDTAASYGNEKAVGEAIAESGIARDELFITSKLWVEDADEKRAEHAIARSLELLGLDYLDVFLIHQPVGDVYGAWRTMERFYEAGILRSIGVSNFSSDRLTDFALHQRIRPMINQIEINPFCQQKAALPINRDLGVAVEAWAPFAEGKNGLFTNPILSSIAKKHDASVGQVVLRWVTQLGCPVISKTTHPERMHENLKALAFTLDNDDMASIASLDTGKSQFFSHQDPAMIRWFIGRHIEH